MDPSNQEVLIRSHSRPANTKDGIVETSRILSGWELVFWKNCPLARRFGLPGFVPKPMPYKQNSPTVKSTLFIRRRRGQPQDA